MKRFILSIALLALTMCSVWAQSLLVGDADQNGELSVADVTKTVNMVLGKEAQTTIDLAALAYKVDNSALAGTWYLGDDFEVFNADGTTSYAGASTYEFRPLQGSLMLYDDGGALLKTFTVLKISEDGLVLREDGGSIVDFSSRALHEYVDLGLPSGTLWATCNIGATNPEDYGDYYAWGETETKSNYEWTNYKWCDGSETALNKYCTDSSSGTVDNLTELDLEDDAAYVKWGGKWRMPTYEQFAELVDRSNTTATFIKQNGVYGRKVTSKLNGNSIFLPAAGYRERTSVYNTPTYGHYWARNLCTSSSIFGFGLYLDHLNNEASFSMDYYNRYEGMSIRPVRTP